ncbi:hypothetical protein ACWNYH_00670 [Candidatus Vidania fulgoroideorum]
MVIVEFKNNQLLLEKNKPIIVKNFGIQGEVIIRKVIFLKSGNTIIKNINKNNIKVVIESKKVKTIKKISIKFKRRKRYLIKKGFKLEYFKLKLKKVIRNGEKESNR